MTDELLDAAQPRDPAIDLLLAEYNSLRRESLEALGHRLTIITFSFGTLALIAFLSRRVSDLFAGLVALLVVPLIAKASLLLWLGEYQRSQRAGAWIRGLEEKLNARVGEKVMWWENHLAEGEKGSKGRHMTYPYVATVIIVLGAGYVGIAAGLLLLHRLIRENFTNWETVIAVAGLALLALGIEFIFLKRFFRLWTAARQLTVPH